MFLGRALELEELGRLPLVDVMLQPEREMHHLRKGNEKARHEHGVEDDRDGQCHARIVPDGREQAVRQAWGTAVRFHGYARLVASHTSSPPARAPGLRMRWVLWGVAALVGIGAGAALVVLRSPSKSATGITSGPATSWPNGVRRAPAFRLSDQNGASVSLAALRGRPVIVTFIDPLCRNYCPIEASRLDSVVRSLPAASRPAILAVSVNVEGNARRYLVQDIHKWRLGPSWRWGVGEPSALASVWREYGIGVLVTRKTIAGVTVDEVTHTEAAYIVDAEGFERALYLWPFTAADVRSTLSRLRG